MGLEIGLFNNGKSDKNIGENGSELLVSNNLKIDPKG